jgi:pimeloyl-ACP methyl ester carboxylesterase
MAERPNPNSGGGKTVATYVLVHGGGHGGWCYKFVAERLRAKGHEVHTPSLTGLAEHEGALSPGIDLDTHIADVVKLLHFQDLRDVILVGHSYGGMVITGAADRACDRVGHLVYLDAANPKNGQSLVDVTSGMILGTRQAGRIVDGVELVLFPGTDPLGFYGVTDPEMIEWMRPRLTPHPWRCFDQPLRLANEETLWRIPQSHLVCTATLPGRDVEALTRAANGRFWDIDTGHDLMLTEPDWVAEMLQRVAEA